MKQSKTELLILIFMAIVVLLIVTTIGLFIRIWQLENQVLFALKSSESIHIGGLEKGIQAPNFTLTDSEGFTISLDDLLGQKVLLVFSSPNCQACKLIYSHLKSISFIKTDIKVAMISKASLEENYLLAEEESFNFQILNGDSTIFNNYKVLVVPFFFMLDEEGIIIKSGLATSLEQMEKIIGLLGN